MKFSIAYEVKLQLHVESPMNAELLTYWSWVENLSAEYRSSLEYLMTKQLRFATVYRRILRKSSVDLPVCVMDKLHFVNTFKRIKGNGGQRDNG